MALVAILPFVFSSCGGGGGGGGGGNTGSAPTSPPFIAAEIDGFPAGSAPPGLTKNAFVSVVDASTGASIPAATVKMNGVTLSYDTNNKDYEGNVNVAAGGTVALTVTVATSTYAVSGNQFSSYPTISAPTSGTTWASDAATSVTWSGGSPTSNSFYVFGIADAAEPTTLVWPFDHFLQEIATPSPPSTNTINLGAATVSSGNRLLLGGIATSIAIPGAASSSTLSIMGFNYVPITVAGMPVTLRDPRVSSNLNAVASSGTLFVAVGDAGTIVTSSDGASWTPRSVPSPNCGITCNAFRGVAWTGSQFVAVGDSGAIFSSANGINWVSRSVSSATNLSAVTWAGTQLVAVGTSSGVGAISLTSPDGITWTPHGPIGAFEILYGVAWSGAVFAATGMNSIYTSADGVSWTSTGLSGSTGSSISWTGSKFVAVIGSGVTTSSDGISWSTQSLGGPVLRTSGFSGSQYVAAGGSGVLFTSPDAVTWTKQGSGTQTSLTGMTWAGTQLVIVGGSGTIITAP